MQKTWKDLPAGLVVFKPGSARDYRTGDWRSQRPEWDKEKCIKCGACYMFCPEGAISMKMDGYPEIDFYFCKGCGICARECWTGCFKMLPEDEAKEKAAKEGKK